MIHEWTKQAWAEWAEASRTLLRLHGNDHWSTLWNDFLEHRIDDVLHIYGVDISLDGVNREHSSGHAIPNSEKATNLHRMQTRETKWSSDLSTLSQGPTEEEALERRNIRSRIRSLLRRYRTRFTQSELRG